MYENTVKLVGFVGQIDVYESEGKQPFAKITLATTNRFIDKQGKQVEKTVWHTLQCFGHLVDSIKGKVRKGSYLSISGELGYDEWRTEKDEKKTAAVIKVNTLYQLVDRKLSQRIEKEASF